MSGGTVPETGCSESIVGPAAWSRDGEPKEAGEVWTLRKGSRVASCRLWTHPKGGEARLSVDGEWHRGEAAADGLALLDLALQWRKQFEGKGWQ